MRAVLLFLSLALGAVATQACILQEGTAPDVGKGDPGVAAARAILACSSDDDCHAGESCSEGMCQMKRCGDAKSYKTAPPLGASTTFLLSRDLVAASGGKVDGYTPRDGTFTRPREGKRTIDVGGEILDLAGGDFFGSQPEAVAAARSGSNQVIVRRGDERVELDVGFVPVAVAAGDVDGDGVAEVVAAAANGSYAVCRVTTKKCDRGQVGATGIADVAIGDVDADGFAEVVFLAGERLVIHNLDAKATEQERIISQPAGKTLSRIVAGDLDGDEIAEIVGIEDGGSMLWNNDNVIAYSFKSGKLETVATLETARGILDVSVVQAGDPAGKVAVLREGNRVEMLELGTFATTPTLRTMYESQLGGPEATRIATADIDGDSPRGKLLGPGKVVAGPTAPIAVLGVPPYSKRFSAGPARVILGSNEAKEETSSTTVELSLTVGVSAEFDLFGLAKAGINASWSQSALKTRGFGRALSVTQVFMMPADPEQNGYDSAGVVLGCGCYMQFDYTVEDPSEQLGKGSNGKTMSVVVPVGGQTSLWSTRRYNALATVLGGGLPKIKMPYKIGNLESYPTSATTLAGKPIPTDDMLFPKPPSFRVSDVGLLGFFLTESTAEWNSEASWVRFGAGAKAGVGVTFSADVGRAVTESYEVRVGRRTEFGGFVEPVKNDARTPEDEFALHGYSFTPYVYRERYTLNDKDAGLFVLMYAVGD